MTIERKGFFGHELKEITFYILFGIIMTIVIPIFLGLGLKAFEESFIEGRPLEFGDFLVSYIIYYIFIIAGLIGLPILKIREMYTTRKGEHPATQSKPTAFGVSFLHDPEQDGGLWHLFESTGLKGRRNPMRWSLSIIRCFIIGTLIFGGLGIIQVITQTAFTSIPQLAFQITPISGTYLTAEPPSFGETTLMILIFSILMGLVAWFTSKFKLGKAIYYIFGIIVVCVAIGLGWMSWHFIAYGNSGAKLIATFIFGSVGSLITLLTGTFIFWYTWHFWNNIFVKLVELVTVKEDLIFIALIIWIILLIVYIFGEILLHKYRKGKVYIPPTPT